MDLHQIISFFGTVILLFIGWLFCKHRKSVHWRTILWGTALQLIFALLVLKTPPGRWLFNFMNDAIVKLLSFQEEGGKFVFNALSIPVGQPGSMGFFFAFQVLTTIVFFSSLISVLYYLGIMQKVVQFFARIMFVTCQTSGAETLSASANIFVGQTEAPLLVRPYIEDMTESELMCVMTGGMATVAGGVMAAYVGMLKGYFPDIAGHLLAASVMSAPAALVMAKIMIPETGHPKTRGTVAIAYKDPSVNVIEAAANGATMGMHLAFNVGAMLVAFMSLLAMANWILQHAIAWFGPEGVTLQRLFGWAFAPLAWVMGAPWKDCQVLGQLMGEKTVLNEFVAYTSLMQHAAAHPGGLAYRSYVIATYALCGFSNFLSIGIQIGGIGAIAPSRKRDLARLGIYALIGGSLASFMTATIAGILVP
ncbi:MAG TPA: nucleoside transporter C-terminal domain-containing protein [Kiritimatiellia bacterium]|nr:nucleoside transporter C-terminal domain-containing protein [Kiritimatiellia bacterium]HRZ12455.1 nucleoside transporter C-terminal domain-containing protein [Kiritimatiellia bacterium]HSA17787.1 nucleoside transporter C-terminal domain-containing protein [Kiritimatiellia bacterium]